MLPTIEQQILGEGENVLKEAFASAALLTNLLVGDVHQMEHRVEEECEQIEREQKVG